MKAVAIVTSEHRNLSTIFVDSHFSSGKVSPEWRLNQGFRTKKKCPFPLNRGVPKERFNYICKQPRWPQSVYSTKIKELE